MDGWMDIWLDVCDPVRLFFSYQVLSQRTVPDEYYGHQKQNGSFPDNDLTTSITFKFGM
jgi:hypothetical protein